VAQTVREADEAKALQAAVKEHGAEIFESPHQVVLIFKTIMVTDGNAAATDEDHNGALIGFYLTFGDIMSTDMLISCLERNSRKFAAE
jgi:hypothetical protein